MNQERRKQIENILSALEKLNTELTDIYDKEYDAWNNIPENLTSSNQSEESSWCVDCMHQAIDKIDEAIGCLDVIFEIHESVEQLDQSPTDMMLTKIIKEIAGDANTRIK